MGFAIVRYDPDEKPSQDLDLAAWEAIERKQLAARVERTGSRVPAQVLEGLRLDRLEDEDLPARLRTATERHQLHAFNPGPATGWVTESWEELRGFYRLRPAPAGADSGDDLRHLDFERA